ncbi:MAG: nitrate reductase subunit beta [Candidatus Melainabacteria bacterium]|nr:nitrate reductase subunit beta [Candidatus Melainabacteria bacterium]
MVRDIRAQVSMVFHLDKCIGCHTCSVACKNIWTDRKGTEYMWWNNVETKPGTGYPTLWEDQSKYKGGWEVAENGQVKIKLQDEVGAIANLFFNPKMPKLEDYYEPFTYDYENLFNAPAGNDQPTARSKSLITGEFMDVESGPNWDDDLGGSNIYAANDKNLDGLSEAEQKELQEIERLVYFYLPRICNHCANPTCAASCPSGALYKRGEDGIVLVNQDACRGWRMCVSACPYKKIYYNWKTGKAEKCILCYPRLETGQAPACFHSCVGRIRYLGVVLYDASKIEDMIQADDKDLVKAQREMIMDPHDPSVIKDALANGMDMSMIESAQKSPIYKFVKEWEIALPLHPEYRTMPMLFYVPPLLPVTGSMDTEGSYKSADDFFSSIESARVPIRYMANLFTAGNEEIVNEVYRKLVSVRLHKRSDTVAGNEFTDVSGEEAKVALEAAGLDEKTAEEIYRITALPTSEERFAVPPMAREMHIEAYGDPELEKGGAGYCSDCSGGCH